MPQFDLADEDIRDLRILLAGFRERKVAHRYQANQGDSCRSNGGGTAADASVQLYRLS